MDKTHVYQKIREYAQTNYSKLNVDDFILGDAPFNSRCHLNAVQKVKEGKADKIYLCFTIDKDNNSQCVHFINQLQNGKFQDNTWGWLFEHSEYYIIKEVNSCEYDKIWDVLNNAKKSLLSIGSNWLERFVYHISYKDI